MQNGTTDYQNIRQIGQKTDKKGSFMAELLLIGAFLRNNNLMLKN
jgi:hypothetical protein